MQRRVESNVHCSGSQFSVAQIEEKLAGPAASAGSRVLNQTGGQPNCLRESKDEVL